MHLFKRINWFSLFAFPVLAAGQLFFATGQPATSLTICGELTDIGGTEIGLTSPDTISVNVKIYTEETGGTAVYTEDFTVDNGHPVIIDKGHFSVILNSVNQSGLLQTTISYSNHLWVEVTVDGDVLTRAPVTSSPYILLNSTPSIKQAVK